MPLKEDLDIVKYPFVGAFYTYEDYEDLEDIPLDERTPKEVLVFETPCDVQKRQGIRQGAHIAAEYTVYFPLTKNPDSKSTVDKYAPVLVRRGHKFRGEAYGYTYEGIVNMVRLSQLGQCSCDIRVETESDL